MDDITSTDLDDWSRRTDAQMHLPTLVRRLIMATVAPGSIRIPAAEGVRLPGFDGEVTATGEPPFVPQGHSVWEMGTSADPADKAQSDYRLRTATTPLDQRAGTTYVCVTSRLWGGAPGWVARKNASGDGWADVRAYDATQLATWLESSPGPRGWLAEHLGRSPFGRKALRDHFADWSESTDPPIPTGVLLAGRRPNARGLLADLMAPPDAIVLASASREESLAFVASALLDADDDSTGESLIERALLITDLPSWRSIVASQKPHLLIAAFEDPDVAAAIRGGHHVVLLESSTGSGEKLPRLEREAARRAWQASGADFADADELAVAARRSLSSLRRRIGRTGRLRRPPWAQRSDATMLAPLLLAGSWRDDSAGDLEVIASLSGREWRTLSRDLSALTSEDDAPIRRNGHEWEFLDPVDAWDNLRQALTSEDLVYFEEQSQRILREPQPRRAGIAELANADEVARYSTTLREGIARTIAILGSVIGPVVLPGGRTGDEVAAAIVRPLLMSADEEAWHALAPSLPLLAEGAPAQFLTAVEAQIAGETK